MGVNSFFNPNYSEDEVWDLLTEYLERKHHVNTTSIQRGIYADINRDGTILSLEDQEYDHATLFCFRNFNCNISGSVIYQLDPPLNEEFNLESICLYLNKPFPKPLSDLALTPEQEIERNENLRLAKIKQQNENLNNFQKAKVKNISLAALYAFEYARASKQIDIAFHYGQINKIVDNAKFIVDKKLNYHFNAVVICAQSPSPDDYLNFLETFRVYEQNLDVDLNEVIQFAKIKIAPNLDDFITPSVRKMGSLILPLCLANGAIISAVIIPDLDDPKDDYEFIKNEEYTGGSIHCFSQSNDLKDLFILTADFQNADAIKSAIPSAQILVTLTANNTLSTIKELKELNSEAVIVVVVDNEYSRVKKYGHAKSFIKSDLTQIAQYLTDNLKTSNNIGIIMPDVVDEFEENEQYPSFFDVLNNLGLERLKQSLNDQISLLADRRSNKEVEINYLLQLHADNHEEINRLHRFDLPNLVQLSDNEDSGSSHGTVLPLVNTKAVNPVLLQESKAEILNWLNAPSSLQENEEFFAVNEAFCSFVADAPPLDLEEINIIKKNQNNKDLEDIF